MIDPNFTFKFGKHSGRTYAWVEENDPTYIDWARKNAPKLLEAPKRKIGQETKVINMEDKPNGLQPNMNFDKEGPDPISIPYLEKMAKEKDSDLDN